MSSLDPNKISRRRILVSGTAIVMAGSQTRAFGSDTGEGQLKAIIKHQGKALEYLYSDGTDLGDYKSEIGGFTQKCICVKRSDFPITVFFRPDINSDRQEVVFELGDVWAEVPVHLSEYSVEIFKGLVKLAEVNVREHFWFSRWRWQSSQRPIVKHVDELIPEGLLPPYSIGGDLLSPALSKAHVSPASPDKPKGLPTSGSVKLPTGGKFTDKGLALGLKNEASVGKKIEYTIMGLAGVTPQMGRTGERPDIGLLTEPQAHFVITGSHDSLSILRAQAEAAGTVPWHMRDHKTYAPVDLERYANMSWYGRGQGDPAIATLDSLVSIDSAHQPALAYLPYLLTGDPYHLEDLQFAANWNRGSLPPGYRLSVPQSRAYAWSARTLAQCARVSPDDVPSWLLPKSYWLTDLDRHRKWLTQTYVNSDEPLRSIFRTIETVEGGQRDEGPKGPKASWIAAWQEDFLACVLGWMVKMGFEDWKPIFDWKIHSTMQRCNGKSGWKRGHSSPYRLLVRKSHEHPFFTTWKESWDATSSAWEWENDDPNLIPDGDYTYYLYTRGALVMAQQLGVPEADEALNWINTQLSRLNAKIYYKWQLG
jgi:hypothetical protein